MEFRTSADHHSKLQNGRVSAPGAAEPAHILPYRRPAAVMVFPKTVEELKPLLQTASAHGITPYILGAGTNVLAPDEGLAGDRHLPEGRTDKHPSSG